MSFVSLLCFSELVALLTPAIASANVFPRLTANALLDAEEAVKTQLEDWLEKPQRHEWLAVGDVASQYDAKTRMSHDRSGDDLRRVIAAGASSSLAKERPATDDGLEKLHGYEWLTRGDVACPGRNETKTTPEDHGKDLQRRVLAGLVDSSTKREDHRLEDRTDKPAKQDLLALMEYGSHAAAKTGEFFADIEEILSRKTE